MTTLFDATGYGPEPPAKRPRKPVPPNAHFDSGWHLLVVRGQVEPDGPLHRIRARDPELMSVTAVCGAVGRAIDVSNELRPGQPIVACRGCLSP